MTDSQPQWPREGYRQEWLALEDASGGRYQMVGDFAVDVPAYNGLFSYLSTQWPQFEDELEILNEETDDSCKRTAVRIYKPKTASLSSLPLVVFFHGGGFIAGNLETEDAQCRYLAAKSPCVVISVDYPKVITPEVTVPIIINDYGVPAVSWCQNRATELGMESVHSKTILCGGSAGAMLASGVTYHFLQKGDFKVVSGLLLPFAVFFPYTYGEDGKYKDKFKAWDQYGRGKVPIIHRDLAEMIWSHYGVDFHDPRYFQGLVTDLSKWPPTYLIAAEKDVFRDDGRLFNELLQEAGVPSKLDFYDGLPHYFHTFPALPVAHEMMDAAVEGLHFLRQSAKSD